MMAPLTRMFCLARKVLDGVSMTFLITDFLDLPFAVTFATLFENETIFFVFPRPISSFVFLSPIFTILVWLCLPVSFRFFGFLCRPPDVFLPAFIMSEEKFDLNRLRFLAVDVALDVPSRMLIRHGTVRLA